MHSAHFEKARPRSARHHVWPGAPAQSERRWQRAAIRAKVTGRVRAALREPDAQQISPPCRPLYSRRLRFVAPMQLFFAFAEFDAWRCEVSLVHRAATDARFPFRLRVFCE